MTSETLGCSLCMNPEVVPLMQPATADEVLSEAQTHILTATSHTQHAETMTRTETHQSRLFTAHLQLTQTGALIRDLYSRNFHTQTTALTTNSLVHQREQINMQNESFKHFKCTLLVFVAFLEDMCLPFNQPVL